MQKKLENNIFCRLTLTRVSATLYIHFLLSNSIDLLKLLLCVFNLFCLILMNHPVAHLRLNYFSCVFYHPVCIQKKVNLTTHLHNSVKEPVEGLKIRRNNLSLGKNN